MSFVPAGNTTFSLKAYIGDKKTLLAFNFPSANEAKNLAGFTIFCQPPGPGPGYYLPNTLQFQNPSKHSQVAGEKPNSTVNAPIQKYRWTVYPGTGQPGPPPLGDYTYTVTPRYFDSSGSMKALDSNLSLPVKVPVGPFKKGAVTLGFTRGYMQSEAFVHRFGANTPIVPKPTPLSFNTSTQAGTVNGQPVTFAQMYDWMGETAREQIFNVLNGVLKDKSLTVKVFAYDLNEPDIVKILLTLAQQGRVRVILDNASLHVAPAGKPPTPEDQFTTQFNQQKKAPSDIERGAFGRYSHDKVFIVLDSAGKATQVLTGSTNWSLTGLYVNANHVLLFEDANVAAHYDAVFEQSWQVLKGNPPRPTAALATAFATTALATQPYNSQPGFVPKMQITFSPHTSADVTKILNGLSSRIMQETSAPNGKGNVIFAVMGLRGGGSAYQTLGNLHTKPVYSYGISDQPTGVFLYSPAQPSGVQVTGKPGKTTLPSPFDQVPSPPGHEIHDKFVVCGLNGSDPVVYCGSSNLSSGGEAANGDNLLAIHDADVATAFAIEALGLIDHYNFLDRMANPKKPTPKKKGQPAKKAQPKKKAKAAAKKKPAKKKAKKKAPAKKKARAKK
jgi:hypothetical protein